MMHLACLEMLNILLYHLFLEFVSRILLSFRKIVIDLLEERSKFSILEFDLNAILFYNFFSNINGGHFNCIMGVILLGESIVLRANTSSNCDFFDFLCILKSNILRIVSVGAISV